MNTRITSQTKCAKIATGGLAAFAFLVAGISVAQNVVIAPANLEQQTARALPVEEPAPVAAETTATPASVAEPAPVAVPVEPTISKSGSEPVVEDYTAKIGDGLKERERRLTLLNEAMMKLREAGEMEDAGRVELRIHALLAMPAPSQANAALKSELEEMRAKNDELIVQMVAMEEELKRFRGTSGTGSVVSRRTR